MITPIMLFATEWQQPITHPPDHTAATHSWMKAEQDKALEEQDDAPVDKGNQLNSGSILSRNTLSHHRANLQIHWTCRWPTRA